MPAVDKIGIAEYGKGGEWMGGRGSTQNSAGSDKYKNYYTKAIFDVQIGENTESLSVILPDVKKTGGARGLPLESDKPFAKNVEVDKNDVIKKIRIHGNDRKMSIDIDWHPVQTNGKPVAHFHRYDDTKNKMKKKETGRSKDHLDIQELPAEYQPLVQCLGKKLSEMNNYREMN